MKVKTPFWRASLITFGMMIAGYVGLVLCGRTKDSPSMFPEVLFMFLMFAGAFAFVASLIWWFLVIIVSSIRGRRAKS